eukprot:2986298-Amphidinium_carterae.1
MQRPRAYIPYFRLCAFATKSANYTAHIKNRVLLAHSFPDQHFPNTHSCDGNDYNCNSKDEGL